MAANICVGMLTLLANVMSATAAYASDEKCRKCGAVIDDVWKNMHQCPKG
jgi:uncharacterized membrane-anchored protein